MKKKTHWWLLLLFVPVIVAGALLFAFTRDTGSVTQILLQHPTLATQTITDATQIGFFTQLLEEADPVDSPARPQEEYESFTLTVDTFTGKTDYTLLLTGSPADCLCRDPKGALLRLEPEAARELLLREGMEFLNENYPLPQITLTLEGTPHSLSPEADWYYRKPDGTFGRRQTAQDASLSLSQLAGLLPALGFSAAPHWSQVTVRENDRVIFEDSAQNLEFFQYKKDGVLQITVEAKWNQEENCARYGQLKASFTLTCDAPTEFATQSQSTAPGELMAFLAKDCLTGDLSVTTDLPGAVHKTLLYAGQRLVLMPIPLGTPAGSYTVTLTGEGKSQSFPLQVQEKEFSREAMEKLSADQLKESFERQEALFDQWMLSAQTEPLWTAPFAAPLGGTNTGELWLSARFGAHLDIAGTPTGVQHTGLDYVTLPGSFVGAANDGTVLFAGQTPYLGNTVVIDHGLGICSVYGCLDSLNVTQGMRIYKGQTVGTLGKSGLTGASVAHFEMRVLGVAVNPSTFFGSDMDFFDLKLLAD